MMGLPQLSAMSAATPLLTNEMSSIASLCWEWLLTHRVYMYIILLDCAASQPVRCLLIRGVLAKEKIPSRASCLPDTFHCILYLLRHHHLMLLTIWDLDLLVAWMMHYDSFFANSFPTAVDLCIEWHQLPITYTYHLSHQGVFCSL